MEVQVLLFVDVDSEKIQDFCRESNISDQESGDLIKAALEGVVSRVVKENFAKSKGLNLSFVTTNIDPKIENSTQCVINLVPGGTYLLDGERSLCEYLKNKIGEKARILSRDDDEKENRQMDSKEI